MSPEYVTKEGLAKLQEELEELVTTKRREMAERIKAARELGDLSENAEYSTAKDEQARIEGRILELRDLIKSASVIEEEEPVMGIARPGSKVKVRARHANQLYSIQEYIIVGSQEASPSKGKISNESPLGRALLGKRVGEKALIKTPKGIVEFEIVRIS